MTCLSNFDVMFKLSSYPELKAMWEEEIRLRAKAFETKDKESRLKANRLWEESCARFCPEVASNATNLDNMFTVWCRITYGTGLDDYHWEEDEEEP